MSMLYEGKAKKIFEAEDKTLVRAEFKDDATAFDGTKKGSISEKGIINATMSAVLFDVLEQAGISTHFVKQESDRVLVLRRVEIIKVEVVVRNRAAGSLVKRLGLERGATLDPPLVEWFYKNDDLHDPLITDDHIRLLDLATEKEMVTIRNQALKINEVLKGVWARAGISLVDFKLEFGRLPEGKIVLADEISPDTCRLWDEKTGKSLDKDRFRFDMGEVESAYQEVLQRLGVEK